MQWNLSKGTDGAESITAVIDGEFYTAEKDHPNYTEIRNTLVETLSDPEHVIDESTLRDLFDVSVKIGQVFQTVSERVKVAAGRVFFDGDEIHNSLTDAILRFHNEQVGDYLPLVKFFEKIKTNPQTHSQGYLYDWLTDNKFTIADDGDIIAYKGVNTDFTSSYSGFAIVNGVAMNGHVPNNPGNVIEMPREKVAFDPNQTCSFGLHAATFQFARGFSPSGIVVKLKINPRDVVSVPVDAHGEKMRVCRYIVVEQVTEAYASPVEYYGTVGSVDEDDEEEFTDDWHDEDEDAEALVEEVESLGARLRRRFGL